MAVSSPPALLDAADRISAALVASLPGLQGICLFGSVARGTATEASDIDLLVVTDEPGRTVSELKALVATELRDAPVSLAAHTPGSLDVYLGRWSRFAAHLRLEGKVIFDRDGRLGDLLGREMPISTRAELDALRRHLRNYDHPERFGTRFLFPLVGLYRIGRAVTFAVLAERGILIFDAEQAFAELGRLTPDRASDLTAVRRLKPFYDLATRRDAGASPPFEPTDCLDELVAAREAVARLLALSSGPSELAA
jgi:predicted nucleotidyltransferase